MLQTQAPWNDTSTSGESTTWPLAPKIKVRRDFLGLPLIVSYRRGEKVTLDRGRKQSAEDTVEETDRAG